MYLPVFGSDALRIADKPTLVAEADRIDSFWLDVVKIDTDSCNGNIKQREHLPEIEEPHKMAEDHGPKLLNSF